MNDLYLTHHAKARMRQRGLRDADLSLLMEVASPIEANVWLLTNEDVAQEVSRLKRRVQRLERLRGAKIVVAGDVVVTAYRSTPKDQRRALRRGRASK
jgi:hypothetical protein